MDELEEKAETVLVSRTPTDSTAEPSDRCSVDGCLNPAVVICEVKVVHMQLNADHETHRLALCHTHEKGFSALQWQWSRTPDAASSRLNLDAVFALDATEES